MMKIVKLLVAVFICTVFLSCNDGDGRDDTILDMTYLTGKNWYYNAWLGDPEGIKSNDLLDVLRFEKGGTLKSIDFSGRREYNVGQWTCNGNRIEMNYWNGNSSVWNVLHSNRDYIETIVNEAGVRVYRTNLDYLGELTADAFIVNEFMEDGQYQSYVGADVRGNRDIREVKMLLSNGKVGGMVHNEYFWSQKDKFERPAEEEDEVRFYIRIGRDKHLKLRDSLYTENLPKYTPDKLNLNVQCISGNLNVTWNAPDMKDVYCKIEVLPENGDVTNPFFVSRIQNPGTENLVIKPTTSGEVNKLNQLKFRKKYMVRLAFLKYEPGTDFLNDGFGYANIQAVSYFKKHFLWE